MCRSLWVISCHCPNLTDLEYVSDFFPATAESLWSLAQGCPYIKALRVPPICLRYDIQTDTQIDRQTDRQTDRQNVVFAHQLYYVTAANFIRQTDTVRQANKQTDRQTDVPTNCSRDVERWNNTDRQTNKECKDRWTVTRN